ncbi:MAG TPA: hypothetical protein VGF28_11650 [Thermoanaerobaculia bacterium]|jgi:hypothetical protein
MRIRTATLLLCTLVCAGQVSAQMGTRVSPRVSEPVDGVVTITATPSAPGANPVTCTIKPGWVPLKDKNSADTLCFWDQLGQDYLKYVRFNASEKSMAMQSDMVTDAFRNIRVTFGAAIAATTDDSTTTTDADEPTAEQDKILNLLKTNGGNLALAASYPIYYKPIGEGSYLWNSYLRLAGNLDAMGGDVEESVTDTDDFNGNLEVSFTEMQLDLLSFNKDFNLLGYFNASAIVGTNKFSDALGANVSSTFVKGTVGAGMRIANRMTIYFTYNKFSDDDIPGDGGAITLVLNQ